MNITININSPELANAILALANALSKEGAQVAQAVPVQEQQMQQYQPQITPIQQQPIQQQAVPVTTPAPVSTPAPVQQQQAPQPSAVPTTEQSYTIDQLAVAATQLMDAGRQQELIQLLNSFGVQALTMLPKKQYGAFATKLRELGAKL